MYTNCLIEVKYIKATSLEYKDLLGFLPKCLTTDHLRVTYHGHFCFRHMVELLGACFLDLEGQLDLPQSFALTPIFTLFPPTPEGKIYLHHIHQRVTHHVCLPSDARHTL